MGFIRYMKKLLLWLMIFMAATPAFAYSPEEFASFLEGVRADASAAGVGSRGLAALNATTFRDNVIRLDRNQPESKITFEQYVKNTVTPARIARGQSLMQQFAPQLARAGQRYNVQPRFIVALWGKETDFGRNMGGTNVIDALATLAYEGRRADFFRTELIAALRIIDQGHVTRDKMIGSWAGAMGQCQFMPTSFFKYAVDGDGDGRIDIWNDEADVFASAANYLYTEGWSDQLTWGREVDAPASLDPIYIGKDKTLTLAEWQIVGVRGSGGEPLPNRDLRASLVQPDGAGGRSFLIYDNFRVLLHWNKSTYFATSVGLLADAIGS